MDNIDESLHKEFDLGAILNITSGRLFTNMDDIHEVLEYLTGNDMYKHMIPESAALAKAYCLLLHPELQGVGKDVKIKNQKDADKFVAEQKKIFGETLPLTPIGKTNEFISSMSK